MSARLDLAGRKFGKLSVISFSHIEGKDSVWLCLCECGKESRHFGYKLKNGHTKSCGCLMRELTCKRNLNRRGVPNKPQNYAAFKKILGFYKSNAKLKGLEFSLTEDEFMDIITKPCFYCEKPPLKLSSTNTGRLLYNGIDRIDNSRGYVLGNVLPCCTRDNKMRNVFLTVEETKVVVTALENFRREKK